MLAELPENAEAIQVEVRGFSASPRSAEAALLGLSRHPAGRLARFGRQLFINLPARLDFQLIESVQLLQRMYVRSYPLTQHVRSTVASVILC